MSRQNVVSYRLRMYESGAASATFIHVVVAIGVILSAIVAAALMIAVIFIEETKTNQPISNAGIAAPPVIDATSYESGLLSWFEDSLHVTSEARNLVAFRRCSGDRDKPTCLVMVSDPSRSATPRAIAGNLVRPYENQFPVAFSAVGLLFAIPPDIFSYDLRTDMTHIVAQDAWAPSLAPNGGTLAYLTTYRSGGANVRLLDLQSKIHQQLTNFEGKSPGGNFIRWLPDGMTLVFELQDDSSHNIESWSVRIDGSGLRRIVEDQIIDPGSARG